MCARRRDVDAGFARGRRLVVDLCRELDGARRSSGLSCAELGRAIGLSGDQVARICRGASPNVSVIRLATLLATVGLELSARAFPAGLPIRDRAHVALLARLKQRIAPSLRWRLEVPVVASASPPYSAGPSDRRAWDAVIEGDGWSIGVEAETRLGDIQALLRRVSLKHRDGTVDLVLLLVNETLHNRRVLGSEGVEVRASFAGSSRQALTSLRQGLKPRVDSLVVL